MKLYVLTRDLGWICFEEPPNAEEEAARLIREGKALMAILAGKDQFILIYEAGRVPLSSLGRLGRRVQRVR